MKEGPEALMGGPPLSLSEGPALSAFRLRPLGRDATLAFLEDVPFPSPWSLALDSSLPVCPVKAFLQQLSLLWCFLLGAVLTGLGREGVGGRRKEMEGVLWAPAVWFLPRPTVLL